MSRERVLPNDLRRLPWHARPLRPRLAVLTATVLGTVLVTAPSALEIPPRFVWNSSASAPLGLYWMAGKSDLERGDLVLAELPEPWLSLADERGYLPSGVPLIKNVAALPGEHICTIGRAIFIGGSIAATRLKRDSKGHLMPGWDGCRLLSADDVFLLNADVPDSFDGRYFGPTTMDEVIGQLVPLWMWSSEQQ
jgi:conjugative transfer signal peptidase TraF